MQLALLWAVSVANSALLLSLVARASVAQRRLRRLGQDNPGVMLGSRLPSLRCRTIMPDGRLSPHRTGTFRPGSVVVFVQPGSVASFRVAELWQRRSRELPSEVAWTWVVVGDQAAARRWIAEFGLEGCAIYYRPRGQVHRLAAAPTAVYLRERGRIAQATAVRDGVTFAAFVVGCPDRRLRDWYVATSAMPGQSPGPGRPAASPTTGNLSEQG